MLQQLREAQPAVPQSVNINNQTLPIMSDKDNVEEFITHLEIAMTSANTPRDKWKQHILAQLTLAAKLRVINLFEDEDAEYDDIK